MTKQEQHELISSKPIIGCTAALAIFCIALSVPLMLFGWLFGSDFAIRMGAGLFLLPIVTLLLWKVMIFVLGLVAWMTGHEG